VDRYDALPGGGLEYRPYPPPRRPWAVRQTWHDLLFAHWRVDAVALRQMIPRPLELDLWQGEAWLGIVAFGMAEVRVRGLPFEWRFPELNVRTYVTLGGRPGVWFFSLDAVSSAAVLAGRHCFHLPYVFAEMTQWRRDDCVELTSRRPGAAFAARYRPIGPTVPVSSRRSTASPPRSAS